MSKSLYSLGFSVDDVNAEFKRLQNIASGSIAGFQSPQYNKEAFKQIDQQIDQWKDEYKKKEGAGSFARIAALRAAQRDSLYMLAGRKYMLKAALTKKSLYLMHKTMGVTNTEYTDPE